MTSLIFLVLHIFGALLWVGGAAAISFLLYAMGPLESDAKKKINQAARAAFFTLVTPGMLLAWTFGLVMLVSNWSQYGRAGWMHAKLTVLLALSAFTGIISKKIRLGTEGVFDGTDKLRGFSFAVVLCALIIVFLAEIRPF